MQVKSYYAASVEEAMSRAGAELGSEAVLVHSRKTPAETRHLGPYEVVFALPRNGGAIAPPRLARPAVGADGGSELSDGRLSLELMQMRRQMEEIRRAVSGRWSPAAPTPSGPAPDRLARMLLATEMDDDLAHEIAATVAAALPEQDGQIEEPALRTALGKEILARLAPPRSAERPSTIAVLGPPGCGKTTTLMKLAARLSETDLRNVRLIAADPFRIGGADQLRSFAAILGTSVEVADTPAAIERLTATAPERGVTLIDTPGLSGSDFELGLAMGRHLASARHIQKMLLLPATMRVRDLRRYIRKYEPFRPDLLVFTRVDETDVFGPMCSIAMWSGLPIGYLSTGQEIPEDLQEAQPDQIVHLVLGVPPKDAEGC